MFTNKHFCLAVSAQFWCVLSIFFGRFYDYWSWKKWVMAHPNQEIYHTPFILHTFRFETRTRTGRTLGTTKLGHLPSIPSRCSLGCRQCTTLQFMAITTAECRMREIETGFIWLAHQVWLIAKWGHLTAFSYYWAWSLLETKYFGGWNASFAKTHKKSIWPN